MKTNIYGRLEAEPGDTIKCNGRTAVIRSVISSDISETGWIIEGRDQNDRYFLWKEAFDGGQFIPKKLNVFDWIDMFMTVTGCDYETASRAYDMEHFPDYNPGDYE